MPKMAKALAVITVPAAVTKKQAKTLRKNARKRLGSKVRVLVVSAGATCQIVPSSMMKGD